MVNQLIDQEEENRGKDEARSRQIKQLKEGEEDEEDESTRKEREGGGGKRKCNSRGKIGIC